MKKKLQVILPIVSIIFVLFSCLVFFLLNKEISFNKKTTEDNEIKWQQEAERRDGIKTLNSSIQKIENEKKLLDTHFADSSNVVPFLDMMESIGKSASVTTEVTLVDIPKESKNLIIEMKATGGFEEIYKFLLLLENSPYELEINSIDLQKQNIGSVLINNKQVPIWTAKFQIKLLSFI